MCVNRDQQDDKDYYGRKTCDDYRADIKQAELDALDDRSEHTNAIYMSILLTLGVYPVIIYYLLSMTKANNLSQLENIFEHFTKSAGQQMAQPNPESH